MTLVDAGCRPCFGPVNCPLSPPSALPLQPFIAMMLDNDEGLYYTNYGPADQGIMNKVGGWAGGWVRRGSEGGQGGLRGQRSEGGVRRRGGAGTARWSGQGDLDMAGREEGGREDGVARGWAMARCAVKGGSCGLRVWLRLRGGLTCAPTTSLSITGDAINS